MRMTSDARDLLRAALAHRLEKMKKKRRKRARRPRLPRKAEQRYERALRAISRAVSREIEKALKPYLDDARERERADADIDVGRVIFEFAGLRARLLRLVGERSTAAVDRAAEETNDENAETLERVIGISLAKEAPRIRTVLDEFRRRNIDLIRSIATEQLDDVERLVRDAGSSGMRVETMAKRLRDRFAISARRASLIARDQTLKLNSQLTQTRHSDAGITKYVWSTSRDERVRDRHSDLEGRVFSWDDPPVTNDAGDRNHPGEDYQCRCVAVPVLE